MKLSLFTGRSVGPNSPKNLQSAIFDLQSLLSRFLVNGVLALLTAEFLQFEPIRAPGLLRSAVVAAAAHRAFQPNVFPHDCPRPTAVCDSWHMSPTRQRGPRWRVGLICHRLFLSASSLIRR